MARRSGLGCRHCGAMPGGGRRSAGRCGPRFGASRGSRAPPRGRQSWARACRGAPLPRPALPGLRAAAAVPPASAAAPVRPRVPPPPPPSARPTHAALPPAQPTPPGLKVTSARSRSHFGRAIEQHRLSPLREGPGPSGAGLLLAGAEREGKKGGRSPPPPPAAAGTAPGSRSSGAGGEPGGSRAAGARRAAVRAGKGGCGGGEPRPAATCPACPLPSDGRGAASFGRRPPLYGEFGRGREEGGGGDGGASRSGGWRDGGGAPAGAGKFPGPPGGCGVGGGGRRGRGDGQSGTAESREIKRRDEENGQAGVSRVTG
ncbi:uncharacterized protein [Excalfactoria chinensis]|uniref:uncharacterized protein n=1 Tax=Excalfactoria chinensis TaxID=46218 RepID=UPI003B3B3B48